MRLTRYLTFLVLFTQLTFILAGAHYLYPTASQADYAQLRDKWRQMLIGSPAAEQNGTEVAQRLTAISEQGLVLWNTLSKEPNRLFLWSDLASITDPSHVSASYNRLQTMALAYATEGSSLYGNTLLRDDIIAALDWMYTWRYGPGVERYGNWWEWEIGSALALNNCVVLLYQDLKARPDGDRVTKYMNAVARYVPRVNDVAANRAWKAAVIGVRGALTNDTAALVDARDSLDQIFAYRSHGDGFYKDGSFIQHATHAYTGGYGVQLLQQVSALLYWLDGSPWQVTSDQQRNVYHWVYDSFEPLIYKGAFMDMVRGRYISRPQADDHSAGHDAIEAIILLAQIAPPADARAFKQMVKYWIATDTAQDFFSTAPLGILKLAHQIVDDPAIPRRGELIAHRSFPNIDRVVHLRPGFGFALSMFSPRIDNFESINGENLKGWYTGSGMTYLYNDDLTQYSDGYWATIDPLRLPGTTVVQEGRGDGSGAGTNNVNAWAGGADIDDAYGVTGMDYKDTYSSLSAKKSWFMFDNEIVALGSNIESSDNRHVQTIIENRKLRSAGDNALLVNSLTGEKPRALPWNEVIHDVSWMHLEGVGGYYFPQRATVTGQRETRTATWKSVNIPYGDDTPVTRSFLSLSIDHGANPADASYAYVLLPSATSGAVQTYAAKPDVRILAQSADVHAVEETSLHILAAAFWQNKMTTVANMLTCDRQAAVIMRAAGRELEVAVADPTHGGSNTITIEIQHKAASILMTDPGVTVVQLAPTIKLKIRVQGTEGQTVKARFFVPTLLPSTAYLPTVAK